MLFACLSLSTIGFATPLCVPLERKVWIIGIDGLRPDALAVANTPNIDSLVANGCYSERAQVGPNTVSGPGWSNMLTGVWSDKHGVTDNSFSGQNYGAYPNLVERVENELADVETAVQLTWAPLFTELVTGADHTFFQDYTNGGDAAGTLDAVDRMANHDPDLMFTYFADVDVAGHNFGFSPGVPQYLAEIEQVDGQVGQILSALRSRVSFGSEDWLILLSTDHGGIGTGHGGGSPQARTIPYLASGPSAKKGVLLPVPSVVDVAVTAMAHLGVASNPAWGLDGIPSGIASQTRLGSNLLANGDAEYSTGNPDFTPDRGISAWRDIGALTVIPYDSGQGFPDSSDPGPPQRGDNFFSGGAGTSNDLSSQRVSVADLAHWIDLGVVEYALSGWLGGYAEQEDRMSLAADFQDESGTTLSTASIGPVTLADRQAAIGGSGEALTGLLERQQAGLLPIGTRRIRFQLLAEHAAGGGTDGYGDNLCFVLSLDPNFDCNRNGFPDAIDIQSGQSLDLDANGTPDECDGAPTTHCSTTPNSVGAGAGIGFDGSIRISANNFVLTSVALPASQPGIFYLGSSATYSPFGEGIRCVAGPITRLPVVSSDANGSATYAVDFNLPPLSGAILPGAPTSFQCWYRDPAGGGAAFNLSHALTVSFVP